jgi:hypothetical protein
MGTKHLSDNYDRFDNYRECNVDHDANNIHDHRNHFTFRLLGQNVSYNSASAGSYTTPNDHYTTLLLSGVDSTATDGNGHWNHFVVDSTLGRRERHYCPYPIYCGGRHYNLLCIARCSGLPQRTCTYHSYHLCALYAYYRSHPYLCRRFIASGKRHQWWHMVEWRSGGCHCGVYQWNGNGDCSGHRCNKLPCIRLYSNNNSKHSQCSIGDKRHHDCLPGIDNNINRYPGGRYLEQQRATDRIGFTNGRRSTWQYTRYCNYHLPNCWLLLFYDCRFCKCDSGTNNRFAIIVCGCHDNIGEYHPGWFLDQFATQRSTSRYYIGSGNR